MSLQQLKFKNRAFKRGLILLPLSFLFVLLLASPILASTVSISPTTAMVGVPTDFTIKGLTSGTQYTIYIDGSLVKNATADSSGYISFSYTFTESGAQSVVVKDGAGSTTVATLTVTVYDIVNMIVPYFVIIIALGVLAGLMKSMTDVFN